MAIIGVVGLGTMGLGIAQLFAIAGHQVCATDGQIAARTTAKDRVAADLSKRVSSGKLLLKDMNAALNRVTILDDLTGFQECDLIIEAIAENTAAKQDLFTGLESIVRPDAVLATNTSALSVAQLARSLAHPERLIGLHFFNPAPAMRLVEMITLPTTASAALTTAKHIMATTGKTVIQCADRPGFIVNRCARPFYGEALAIYEDGTNPADIDAAMLFAGYRIGPFALIDLIGADINLAATQTMFAAMGEHPRYHVFQSLIDQVTAGKLGRKTGAGFLIGTTVKPKKDDAIVLRIEATLVNEAATLLEESALTHEDIDLAVRMGLNFPRGPFEAATRWGIEAIQVQLKAMEVAAPASMKPRYRQSPALAALHSAVASDRLRPL
jgi:3-hydroxybutyryl-CoA dehydrogenase